MDFDEVLLQKSQQICSNLPNLVCFAQIPPDLDALMRSVLLAAPATVALHDASCLRVLLRLLSGLRSRGCCSCGVRAENAKVAPHAVLYELVVQKRGQPLCECFRIAKVLAARLACIRMAMI